MANFEGFLWIFSSNSRHRELGGMITSKRVSKCSVWEGIRGCFLAGIIEDQVVLPLNINKSVKINVTSIWKLLLLEK